jgi:heme-degrading monooxygenase HmoA
MSVKMIVDVRVKPGSQDDLAHAYRALRERAQEEPGLISHQLCQCSDDPERFLVISEWDSAETSSDWDRSEDHARLLAPMRACFAQASRSAFQVRDGVRT